MINCHQNEKNGQKGYLCFNIITVTFVNSQQTFKVMYINLFTAIIIEIY